MPDAPRKQPTQERARATVDAILMAAAHILKKEGFEQASTNQIARVAGVSIGSLYQYYPNKQAIIGELRKRNEEWFWECVSSEFERVRSLPIRPAARAMVSLLIALHASDPDFHNVLVKGQSPNYPEAYSEAAEGFLRDYIEAHRDEIRPVDPELASFIMLRTIEALVHETTLNSPERLQDPRFAEEVTELLARYLERY